MKDVVILSAVRTPLGSFRGSLASVPAPRLGAAAIRAAVERSGIEVETVDQVIMGNVLQAGIGQAPARQAGIYGGVPKKAGAITLNKVGGSGLRAVLDAANGIRVGDWSTVIAGGIESMSKAPHLRVRSRDGYRRGQVKVAAPRIQDGRGDSDAHQHMGLCGETVATWYSLSRA